MRSTVLGVSEWYCLRGVGVQYVVCDMRYCVNSVVCAGCGVRCAV